MFDYNYYPQRLSEELNQQIRNFSYKAQILADGRTFLELGNGILKAQFGERYFELVVFLPHGYRTIEVANLLHRLVQGGAKVGVFDIEIFDQELEQFAIFDNKLLISNRIGGGEKNIFQRLLKKQNEFERIMESSQPVCASSQEIKMKFWSTSYFVEKGALVKLSWNIEEANSSILNPGNLVIEPTGSTDFLIEKDILFTITSRNAKNKSTLSIFIKCIEEQPLTMTVSIFNRDLSDYVKIDPIVLGEESFAVYKGDLVRIEWTCRAAVSLTESLMGKLKNIGHHNFIALENRVFDFEVSLANGIFKKVLKIYPFSADDTLSRFSAIGRSNPDISYLKSPKRLKNKLLSWIGQILGISKNNGNNEGF